MYCRPTVPDHKVAMKICNQRFCSILQPCAESLKLTLFAVWLVSCIKVIDSLPVPTSPETRNIELGYVKTEAENAWCFEEYDDKDCPPGRWYNKTTKDTGRYCFRCEPLQNGTGTYQPQESHCPSCIICPECPEGREVIEPCSITSPPVCGDIKKVTSRETSPHHPYTTTTATVVFQANATEPPGDSVIKTTVERESHKSM